MKIAVEELKERKRKRDREYSQRPEIKERKRNRNQEYYPRYRERNREKLRKYLREYMRTYQHLPEVREKRKKYEQKYKVEYMKRPGVSERKREYQRKWDRVHRKLPEFKERQRKNPENLLAIHLRQMCSEILRGRKSFRTIELIGCSFGFLRNHLEAQFQPGMTWENRGRQGWHIDHKVPISWFRGLLHDPEWQQVACHYTNLQPLWGVENIKKGNRYAA